MSAKLPRHIFRNGLFIIVPLLVFAVSIQGDPSFADTKVITKKVQIQTAISKMKARLVVVQN